MTSDAILIEFKKYGLSIIDEYKPTKEEIRTDIWGTYDKALAIAIMHKTQELVVRLEYKENDLLEEADDGVLIDVCKHNLNGIKRDIVNELERRCTMPQ